MEISQKEIVDKIFLIRGHKIKLDRDLAEMYGVETKALKQAVKRNKDIFPGHFMFELTKTEFNNMRSQIVTSSWGGERYLPFAFTEHGVLQLANVLKSRRARQMSIRTIDVFVSMREMLITHKDILIKLKAIEKKLLQHDHHLKNHEDKIQVIFEALKQLLEPIQIPRKKIGYRRNNDKE